MKTMPLGLRVGVPIALLIVIGAGAGTMYFKTHKSPRIVPPDEIASRDATNESLDLDQALIESEIKILDQQLVSHAEERSSIKQAARLLKLTSSYFEKLSNRIDDARANGVNTTALEGELNDIDARVRNAEIALSARSPDVEAFVTEMKAVRNNARTILNVLKRVKTAVGGTR